MKLDPRIKSLSDILTCFDIERAERFERKKGFFANSIDCFRAGEPYCKYGTLLDVFDTPDQADPFQRREDGDLYSFFLPESCLKPEEKKLRPYTLEEFKGKFSIGEPIKFRKKGEEGDELYFILNGYSRRQFRNVTVQYINLGGVLFTLKELFDGYEWCEDATGSWAPFSVEVEE